MYNVCYEICTISFLIVLMLSFSMKKQMNDRQSKVFRCFLMLVLGYLVLDVLLSFTIRYHQMPMRAINMVISTAVIFLQNLVLAVFVTYIGILGQQKAKKGKGMKCLIAAPVFLTIALLAANPFTKSVFYINSRGYRRGPLYVLLYVIAAAYLLGTLIYIIRIHKELPKKKFPLFLLVIGIVILMTVLQYVYPDDSLIGMGIGIALFIMYLTIENPTIYADTLTSALNRQAFTLRTSQMREKGKPFYIFAIALDNFKIINEVFGMEGGNRIMQMLVEKLHRSYSKSQVFRYHGDIFALILEEQYESTKELDRIRKILRSRWTINGVDVELGACICRIPPKFYMKSDSELVKAVDYAISEAKSRGKNQYFELDEDAAEDMTRRAAIEQAMMSAIEEGKFEVHYQPIYDTKHQCFHSLEALARLNVPEYGYVSPEEFIRIAEQNGMIIEIGMLVLEEVCRLIAGENLREKGIEFVEVNLSVVQCMQENCYDDILKLLAKYDIPPEMINLEITESAAVYSEERLVHNMARLSLTDITFSLDDYGSGYSNINYLVDLPFSIVKIDKYFVWAAFKKLKMRKILENTIVMFNNINLNIVAEGIEDEEMVKVLTEMGARYLQGYNFAKPLPKDKLLQLLQGG